MSMTLQLLKQRKLERQSKNKYHSKRIESEIVNELKSVLAEYLQDNDRIMLEVDPKVLGEFQNIIDTDSISAVYEYEQVESNLYVFSNRDLYI